MAIGLVDPAAGILTPPRAQHPAHSFHFTLILFPYPVFFFLYPLRKELLFTSSGLFLLIRSSGSLPLTSMSRV